VTAKPSHLHRVAIFGATSDIAFAVARRLVEAGAGVVLVGRDMDALERATSDLKIRGAPEVHIRQADFSRTSDLAAVADAAWDAFGGLDLALVAFGSMPKQDMAEADTCLAEQTLLINFVSPVLLCNVLAQRFESQGSGTIAVITSVAGDRGRKSNFIYGAAKGGLQRYLEGLRHRLFVKNVTVLDIRPGFVLTKMTTDMQQGGPLWASPDRIAKDILAGVKSQGAVLYTPWFWRFIMMGVRNLPAPLFHRIPL
jgi:decaprenylphospho-beta-D-erythro-pentofuranosid-2-ulose 2-reductase